MTRDEVLETLKVLRWINERGGLTIQDQDEDMDGEWVYHDRSPEDYELEQWVDEYLKDTERAG